MLPANALEIEESVCKEKERVYGEGGHKGHQKNTSGFLILLPHTSTYFMDLCKIPLDLYKYSLPSLKLEKVTFNYLQA